MERPIQVKELNQYLKKYLSMDYLLGRVTVEGELSNVKLHHSGHMYFSLKDDSAKVSCAMFRWEEKGVTFLPREGKKVVVRGAISFYTKEGTLQLYVEEMEEAGMGDLYLEFLKLKEALEKEGLFASEHKKTLPSFVRKIGVITSPQGAAVRDIIQVAGRRNEKVDILLYPVAVQGEGAPSSLREAMSYMGKREDLDLVIIGRGGGAYEDLACFNDEGLARCIYNSKVPVISAVGHETDFTIADFVADFRAPTPSAAAEIAVPSLGEILMNLQLLQEKGLREIRHRFKVEQKNLDLLHNQLLPYHPRGFLESKKRDLEEWMLRGNYQMKERILKEQTILSSYLQRISERNPKRRLALEARRLEDLKGRGIMAFHLLFSRERDGLGGLFKRLTRAKENIPHYVIATEEGYVNSIEDLEVGDLLRIYDHCGFVESEVKGVFVNGERNEL